MVHCARSMDFSPMKWSFSVCPMNLAAICAVIGHLLATISVNMFRFSHCSQNCSSFYSFFTDVISVDAKFIYGQRIPQQENEKNYKYLKFLLLLNIERHFRIIFSRIIWCSELSCGFSFQYLLSLYFFVSIFPYRYRFQCIVYVKHQICVCVVYTDSIVCLKNLWPTSCALTPMAQYFDKQIFIYFGKRQTNVFLWSWFDLIWANC